MTSDKSYRYYVSLTSCDEKGIPPMWSLYPKSVTPV